MKFNQNSNIFIQENVFESVVCEMASILSRPQCVKGIIISHGIDPVLQEYSVLKCLSMGNSMFKCYHA